MQAPQLRLNERQANPNPYIIFIRSLRNKKDHTDAEEILKAVAAQMKTIMRDRFMQVHTLEEAAFNKVFAGRNWNHGQSIELVLRGPSGRFLPMPYIISVMCHEMAHIEQMNHGPKFQKLMAEIKADVSRSQARGYFGDGFWSDGKRLADSVQMGGEGLRPSDFPEYVCGVSAADARKAKRPTRGPGSSQYPGMVKGEASHLSGRQTDYRRKAGRRNNADMGEEGTRLDGGRQITKEDREARKVFVDARAQELVRRGMSATAARRKAGEMFVLENPWWKEGSSRGKVAKSKSAAEMRAAAAERRLAAFAGSSTLSTIKADPSTQAKTERFSPSPSASDEDEREGLDDTKPALDLAEEGQVSDPHLDAEERKREMEAEMDEDEMRNLRGGWEEYVEQVEGHSRCGDGEGEGEDIKPSRGKRRASPSLLGDRAAAGGSKSSRVAGRGLKFGQGFVDAQRSKAGTKLGSDTATGSSNKARRLPIESKNDSLTQLVPDSQELLDWSCKVCTSVNLGGYAMCEMCGADPDGIISPNGW